MLSEGKPVKAIKLQAEAQALARGYRLNRLQLQQPTDLEKKSLETNNLKHMKTNIHLKNERGEYIYYI